MLVQGQVFERRYWGIVVVDIQFFGFEGFCIIGFFIELVCVIYDIIVVFQFVEFGINVINDVMNQCCGNWFINSLYVCFGYCVGQYLCGVGVVFKEEQWVIRVGMVILEVEVVVVNQCSDV